MSCMGVKLIGLPCLSTPGHWCAQSALQQTPCFMELHGLKMTRKNGNELDLTWLNLNLNGRLELLNSWTDCAIHHAHTSNGLKVCMAMSPCWIGQIVMHGGQTHEPAMTFCLKTSKHMKCSPTGKLFCNWTSSICACVINFFAVPCIGAHVTTFLLCAWCSLCAQFGYMLVPSPETWMTHGLMMCFVEVF